jgi:hypothetical protein
MTRTLYDLPQSNNGARCRTIHYHKNLSPDIVSIVSPTSLADGGMNSIEYRMIHPQTKVPAYQEIVNNIEYT